MKYDVFGDSVLELNITGLQPDTIYAVQVAALTRKGDGDRSKPENVRTPGGVPNRPDLNFKYEIIDLLTLLFYNIISLGLLKGNQQ